jgi:hypothetical protein
MIVFEVYDWRRKNTRFTSFEENLLACRLSSRFLINEEESLMVRDILHNVFLFGMGSSPIVKTLLDLYNITA